MIHLDTNYAIQTLIAGTKEHADVRRWISANEPLSISVVALGEFLCGPIDQREIERLLMLLDPPVVFTIDAAQIAADLYNGTGRRRGSFPDCMIAATAINACAELATSNRADFERMVPLGLTLA